MYGRISLCAASLLILTMSHSKLVLATEYLIAYRTTMPNGSMASSPVEKPRTQPPGFVPIASSKPGLQVMIQLHIYGYLEKVKKCLALVYCSNLTRSMNSRLGKKCADVRHVCLDFFTSQLIGLGQQSSMNASINITRQPDQPSCPTSTDPRNVLQRHSSPHSSNKCSLRWSIWEYLAHQC